MSPITYEEIAVLGWCRERYANTNKEARLFERTGSVSPSVPKTTSSFRHPRPHAWHRKTGRIRFCPLSQKNGLRQTAVFRLVQRRIGLNV